MHCKIRGVAWALSRVNYQLDPFCYPKDVMFSKVEECESTLLEKNDRELCEPITIGSTKPHHTVFVRQTDSSWHVSKVLEVNERSSNPKNWELVVAVDQKRRVKKRKFGEYRTKKVGTCKMNTEGGPQPYATCGGVPICNPNKVLRRRTANSAPKNVLLLLLLLLHRLN